MSFHTFTASAKRALSAILSLRERRAARLSLPAPLSLLFTGTFNERAVGNRLSGGIWFSLLLLKLIKNVNAILWNTGKLVHRCLPPSMGETPVPLGAGEHRFHGMFVSCKKREVIGWESSDEENIEAFRLQLRKKTVWFCMETGWVSDPRRGFWSEPGGVPCGW